MESKEVSVLVKNLEKNKTNDKVVLEILKTLEKDVVATEKLLRETKVGVEVNKFKKSSNQEIASMVKKIIGSWKDSINRQKRSKLSSTSTPSPSTNASMHDKQSHKTGTSESKKDDKSTHINKSTVAKGKPRNSRIDGVNTTLYNHKLRDMVVKALYDALVKDSTESSSLILKLATEVELEMKKFSDPDVNEKQYRDKYRVVYSNLISKNNPELKFRIVGGDVSPARLVTCDPKELAPESLKKELEEIAKKNLYNAQGATVQRSVTDRFTCGKCKEKKVSYYQLQTRSADEPLTTFCTCEACGNRWKFS
ncbi:hypothetical protein TBLA_0C04310 [Henningerozyma blattae CBS 6284]|uniref:Transcription elongation factor n=1 Tax=Henningerozyma blattae (strain ATCC 34711 / CBS 6284 / DSM 70876 / NBRC 10599 / NRRL Y-10934 / UCD 77-7) TaxID=1071380 RepID=I2H1H7_HENB6|nr:hypothetical protein TBLA_0C04310 [Tetrapisispora blattae CBS 6284]CCH60229.1 hypothetical protein TBLA_0C04310 [Tetrapisispora blattae CBS 6284]